jgi:glyoxylase-like metal-dependent hydrolase (beta-lactamase superfamily II)
VAAWVIEGEDGPVLVDTGIDTPAARGALRAAAGALGIGRGGLAAVVLTHAHIDHYGLGGHARAWGRAPLVLHAREDELARRFVHLWPEDRAGVAEHFRASGMPADLARALLEASDRIHSRYTYWEPDILLRGGEGELPFASGWRWILTPGHSPGHVVLHHPRRRLLIAGDHVLPRITPNIGADLYAEDPLSEYLGSLAALRDLPVDLVLPSHGEPFADLAARVDAILAHHAARATALLDALGEPCTAVEAALALFPDLGPDTFLHGLRETRAHLVHLAAEGRLDRDVRRGVELWFRR